MGKHVRELCNTELKQIAGGFPIVFGGLPATPDWGVGDNPHGGVDPGSSAKIPIVFGGDWWKPLPSPGKP